MFYIILVLLFYKTFDIIYICHKYELLVLNVLCKIKTKVELEIMQNFFFNLFYYLIIETRSEPFFNNIYILDIIDYYIYIFIYYRSWPTSQTVWKKWNKILDGFYCAVEGLEVLRSDFSIPKEELFTFKRHLDKHFKIDNHIYV